MFFGVEITGSARYALTFKTSFWETLDGVSAVVAVLFFVFAQSITLSPLARHSTCE